MKKFLTVSLFVIAGMLSVNADIIYPDGNKPIPSEPASINKIARGLNNVIFFPIEILKATTEATEEHGTMSFAPLTIGPTRGIYNGFRRLESGLYDLATAFANDRQLYPMEEYLDLMKATTASDFLDF